MIKIIDISTFQRNVNYQAVKDSGVQGVILKVGYTGYGTAKRMNLDAMFETHYAGFTKVGLPIGVYWYSCAYSKAEALVEAEKTLFFIKDKVIALPIFIDIEDAHDTTKILNSKTNHLILGKAGKLTEIVVTYLKKIESAGYCAGLYIRPSWLKAYIDVPQIREYDLWLAQYEVEKPSYTGEWLMWQHSERGRVPGISGYCDLNWADESILPENHKVEVVSAPVEEDVEVALWFSKVMTVTQGMYNAYSHKERAAIDEAGPDIGKTRMRAPFSCVITWKQTTGIRTGIQISNTKRVRCPDGHIYEPYTLHAFLWHDDDISDLYIGMKLPQHTPFYDEGRAGRASGNHIHVQAYTGPYKGGYPLVQNKIGTWEVPNERLLHELFFVDDVIIRKSGGYAWKVSK